MLEELRENVLSLLEERVERAINTIHRLREDKSALESQVRQSHDELSQRDTQIQELEERIAELQHAESELEVLQEKREQERQEIDREKAEIRARLEGLMALLNSVDNAQEKQTSEPTPPAGDSLGTAASALSPPSDNPSTEETPSTTA